jgi:TolB-like protein/Tfp pilus assembly protein PilF
MNEFFQRLKQRKLVQWTIAYVAAAFALLQGIDIVAQQFGWPEAVRRGITLALVVGFFVTLVLAWYHGERGAQRVTGTELLIIALVLALGGGLLWRFAASSHSADNKNLPNEQRSATDTIPDKSIAVLPFENLSSDKENAYFAAGLQDEILSRLAGLGELKVISRASTEKYPSRPQNLKTVATELGVANILEGSVQKLANEAHINVQLINALTDSHVWAQSYDRTLEHVFVVEGEIAQRVADALRVKLLPEQIKKLNVLPTQNSHAYDLLLKGEYALDRAWKSGKDEKDLDLAISYFEEAVKLDSQFALAFAQLAYAEATKYRFGHIDYSAKRVPELRTRAKAHADEALRLKPDLALAHVVLGKLEEDDNLAIAEFKRALEIDPRLSEAILEIGYYALSRGRVDEAIEAYSKALEFDPRNVLLLRLLAVGYMMRKDYAQSVEFESRALALDPTSEIDAANVAESIVQDKGDISAALRVLDTVPLEQQQSYSFAERKRWLLTLRRDFPAAYEVVENVPAENWRTSWRRPMLLGEIQIALGQKQRGRQLLEEARTNVTAAIAKDSKEELSHGNLALIDSELGLSDEALREADQAVELQPMKKDAFRAPQWLENRAKVNVRLGRIDEAIEQLEQMIILPLHTISAWDLKLDPAWDPLRNDPRFQKLVAAEEAQEKH